MGLNFGNHHKEEKVRSIIFNTEIGGIFSIISTSLIFSYLVVMFIKMKNKGKNNINEIQFVSNWNSLANDQKTSSNFAEISF